MLNSHVSTGQDLDLGCLRYSLTGRKYPSNSLYLSLSTSDEKRRKITQKYFSILQGPPSTFGLSKLFPFGGSRSHRLVSMRFNGNDRLVLITFLIFRVHRKFERKFLLFWAMFTTRVQCYQMKKVK